MSLLLPSCRLSLPAFFPDGTHAVVRGVDAGDLASVHTAGVEMNAFHLQARPGARSIQTMGGLHAFSGWHGPILTDSGGFQLYSLLQENSSLGVIRKDHIRYRTSAEQEYQQLSPEKSIQTQFQLGSDIMMCLDYCTHADEPLEKQEEAVAYTLRWAQTCRDTYMRIWKGSGEPGDGLPYDAATPKEQARPLLFAVIQGGNDKALRKACAESLAAMGFDGFGFGGWPLDEQGLMVDILRYVAELVPDPAVVYAMGVGRPEEIVLCTRMGYRLFDCVIPTREARHQRLYVWKENPAQADLDTAFYRFHYILDDVHQRDTRPVDVHCDCPCCSRYSRAYLRHLFKVGDQLGQRLATLHNLRFYSRLMERLQEDACGT